MPVYYLTADLLFSSRVSGAASNLGIDLQIVGSVTKLLECAEAAAGCKLVLIDLTLSTLEPGAAVQAIRERLPQARIVAYGPHVQETLLTAAAAAGCDEVLSRGQFDREFPRLLRSAMGQI
jgi:DNA-binding NarL/FixJ family response regulator